MAIPGSGEIAEHLRRSTVLIHSGGRGAGSGVIWSSDGLLVTNAHVIRSARPTVQLWDGREFEASVQSCDPQRDLAQLRIKAANLPAASAADSSCDILLGTEEKRFGSLEGLARALQGNGQRAVRLEFLRGDYERIRRVTVQLGNPVSARSSVAA